MKNRIKAASTDSAVAVMEQPVAANGKAKAKAEPQGFNIPAPSFGLMKITLVSDSPLIMHKFSAKAQAMILEKQMKKAQRAKAAKDPEEEYRDSIHWIGDPADKKYGFPTIGFKSAAVDACTQVSGVTKVFARGAFHVLGELAEIQGEPHMRQDMVRLNGMTADVRFRAEFPVWSTELTIRYNRDTISPAQIANLFNTAGFSVGIGEWRPARDGGFGMFHVAAASAT